MSLYSIFVIKDAWLTNVCYQLVRVALEYAFFKEFEQLGVGKG